MNPRSVSFVFCALALLVTPMAMALSFPQPTGYVNDFANVMDGASVQELSSMAAEIEKNSSVEVAVVTVTTLQNATVEEYAAKLFESWGIGKKSKDNGLLILVAPNERKWRIEVGYGLEGMITDATAGSVGRSCFTDNFRALRYGDGLKCAVSQFGYIMNGGNISFGNDASGYPSDDGQSIDDAEKIVLTLLLVFAAPIIFIVIIVILIALGIIKPKPGRRGHRDGWDGSSGGGSGGGGGFGGGGSGGGGASGGW